MRKGFYSNYSDELFTIYRVRNIPLRITQYYLKDSQGKKFSDDPAFFHNELSLFIPSHNTLYAIDDIISTRRKRGKIQKLVTWRGYPKDLQTWIDADQIENI